MIRDGRPGPAPAPMPKPKPSPVPTGPPKFAAPFFPGARIHPASLRSVQLGTGRAKTRIPASAAAEFIAKRTTKGRAA